jgi:hypothetical protein
VDTAPLKVITPSANTTRTTGSASGTVVVEGDVVDVVVVVEVEVGTVVGGTVVAGTVDGGTNGSLHLGESSIDLTPSRSSTFRNTSIGDSNGARHTMRPD